MKSLCLHNLEEAAKTKVSGSGLSPVRCLLQNAAFLGPPLGIVSVQDNQVTDFPGTLEEGDREHVRGEMTGGGQRKWGGSRSARWGLGRGRGRSRSAKWVWARAAGQRGKGMSGPLVPMRSGGHSAKGPRNLGSVGLPAASTPPPEHPCTGDEAPATARVLWGGRRGEPRTHTRDPVSGLRGPAPGGGGRSGEGSAGAPPSVHMRRGPLPPPAVPRRPGSAGPPCFPRDGNCPFIHRGVQSPLQSPVLSTVPKCPFRAYLHPGSGPSQRHVRHQPSPLSGRWASAPL